MQIRSSFFIFILSNLVISFLNAQEKSHDSLIVLEYQELTQSFGEHLNDSIIAVRYANAFIRKARKEKDTLNMVRGYYYKLILDQKKDRLFHLYDTIIDLSKNFKNENFPAVAYFDKGVIYHRRYLFKNALENYIKASKYNDGSRKDNLDFLINQSLGQLKSTIGNDDEALVLTKSCYKYVIEQNYKEEDSPLYYNVLFSLANAYRKTNHIDSARVYNRLGLLDKNRSENSINYNHFLMLDGILKYHSKEYAEAEINILRALPEIENVGDQTTLVLGYFFLGKTYSELKNKPKALDHFKKVDSIFQNTDNITPELTDAYQYIIKYYKENNNIEEQLKYTERLIRVDSTLTNRYKYLNKEIIAQFDIPKLISSKEKLISKLTSDKKKSKTSSMLLIVGLTAILGIAIYQFKKITFYKRRFKELINTDATVQKSEVQPETSEQVNLDVPEEIINDILDQLTVFEEKHNYINPKITLHNLAQKINTNSSYLSKVINHYKQKSFASYIKQLRIHYIFNRLKSEEKLRRFTIKAIAEECGFKSAESFSKTFYGIYGIYPSFFIKQLKKSAQKLS